MSLLKPFGDDIWTMDGDPVRMFGVIPFTTRMTVIRLSDGGLWLHSPIAPTPPRREAVDAAGAARHVVAPNKIHSLWVRPWKDAAPEAEIWVSPEFKARHPDIPAGGVLLDGADPPWSAEIDHIAVAGHAFLDEVVFLHRRSKTLILTDLIQKHVAAGETWLWRLVKRAGGVLGEKGGMPLDLRLSFRDRAAARACVQRIMAWDFDHLILSHGHCVQNDAKEHVARAFAWLLG